MHLATNKPVGYLSHRLNKAKRNYLQTLLKHSCILFPAAQNLLLDGKGQLQSPLLKKDLHGNAVGSVGHSVKVVLNSYPKTSTPDLNETTMSENTSSDFTSSKSEPSSKTSQETSSESKSSSSSDPTAAESSLDKDDPIQCTKPVMSADNSESEQDNDSNDEPLSVPDDNTIDENSNVHKEMDEELLVGNGDEHPNPEEDILISDIEMKLLKGDQADYEGGDKGTNEAKDSAQRRKVLKSPTIQNQGRQMKPDSTADGNYRLPAFSVLAQSILKGQDSLNDVDHDQKVDKLDQCHLTSSFQITKSGDVKTV